MAEDANLIEGVRKYIRYFMKIHSDLSQKDIAQKFGMSESDFSNIKNPDYPYSIAEKRVKKFSRKLRSDEILYFTGIEKHSIAPIGSSVFVRHLGVVCAGKGDTVMSDVLFKDWEVPSSWVDQRPDCYAFVTVSGTSMELFGFQDKDYLLIKLQSLPEEFGNGDITIADVEGQGELLRKFFWVDTGHVYMLQSGSNNNKHVPFLSSERKIRLIGKVVSFKRDI